MWFVLILGLQLLYIPNEIKGINVGLKDLEPNWLFDEQKKTARSVDSDSSVNAGNVDSYRDVRDTQHHTSDQKQGKRRYKRHSSRSSKETISGNTRQKHKKTRLKNGGTRDIQDTEYVRDKPTNIDCYFDRLERNREDRPVKNSKDTKPHEVKQDKNIREFTAHVYRESLITLRDIKVAVNTTEVKGVVDNETKIFKHKFADFVNETLHQKIKTERGKQRVILNVIEVSQHMLKVVARSIKFEIEQQRGKGHLREYEDFKSEELDRRIDSQVELQYMHACETFDICRCNHGFTNFLDTFVTEILRNDDDKLLQANNAITEEFKRVDVSDLVDDDKIARRLRKKVCDLETMTAEDLRFTYQTFRNMLRKGHGPIDVYTLDDSAVNKSLAIRDLVDIFDEELIPTTEVRAEWETIKTVMAEWGLGQRNKVQDAAKDTVRLILEKGVARMGLESKQTIRENLAVILKE